MHLPESVTCERMQMHLEKRIMEDPFLDYSC
jgi:hypothetical protein